MIAVLLVFALVSTTSFAETVDASSVKAVAINGRKIIGGQDADIKDFSYQAALLVDGKFDCGVALIGPRRVVTAAHCLDGRALGRLSVRFGSSKANEGGFVIAAAKSVFHPQWNPTTIDYDVGYVEFDEDVPLSDSVQIIELAREQPESGALSNITGYGLDGHGQLPEFLQVIQEPVLSASECRSIIGSILTDRMLCAGDLQGRTDACSGDSGGPLVVEGKLVGIVSFGFGCATRGRPGVYANVPYFADYLSQ